MRPATEIADELFEASIKASDDYGVPTNAEELAYLLPIVQKRDREVTIHVLQTVHLAIEKEEKQHTGQAAYTLGIARRIVESMLGAIGAEEEKKDT
jgi:hypothetical protein